MSEPRRATARQQIGALAHDWPRFLRHIGRSWPLIRNRGERLEWDGRGVRCGWQFTSDLHLSRIVPVTGRWLLERALLDWPIRLREALPSGAPEVSFVFGHRGRERLPHLLATLRSVAGQTGVSVEAVVVEQSVQPEVRADLPAWVRYVHTPVDSGMEYCRSATFNAGVAAARGEVLVLHDNDILVPERYAAEARARIEEGWDFADLKRFTFYLREADTASALATGEIGPDVRPTVVQNLQGASIVVRRSAFSRIGGFDEEFVGWGGEDNDFWERAAAGGRVLGFGYLPLVHLWHAPQKGKVLGREAPAIRRYHELKSIPPAVRIEQLLARQKAGQGAGEAEASRRTARNSATR